MGSPWTRTVAVVSPNRDSRGANIHSGLRGHRDLSGCASGPADTHSLEPVPQCNCSTPVSCSFPGMSSRKAPAPHAAIFPQEGTLQEDHPLAVCQLWIQPRSPAPLDMPWVLDLTSSFATSWLQLPSTSYASPSDPLLKHWVQTVLILPTTSAHLTSALPGPCHSQRVLPAG